MRKFFTFVVAAFAALSINAKEDIDISAFKLNEQPAVSADGVATFPGGWSWLAVDYSNGGAYSDKSAFEYVVVEYSAGTCADASLIAQYEPDGTKGDYGPNYYNTSLSFSINPTGGLMAVKLDPEHSKTVNSIVIQNHNKVGTITIKAAYFASQAEYEAAKAEADKIEKQLELDATGGTHTLKEKDWGWDQNWLNKDVSDFNTIVFEIASVSGHGKIALQGAKTTEKNAQGNYVKDDEGEIDLPASDSPVTYAFDISSWKGMLVYAFQNLNKPDGDGYGQQDIQETKIVVSKVYLTSKTVAEVTGISNPVIAAKTNPNAPIFNLAGQKVSKAYKGVVIQNGKKFVQK